MYSIAFKKFSAQAYPLVEIIACAQSFLSKFFYHFLHEYPMASRINSALVLSFLMSCMFAGASSAQTTSELSSMGVSEIRDQANVLIDQGQFIAARPLLEELIRRLSEMPDKSQLEHLNFFLGFSYVDEYKATRTASYLEQAIEYFDKVIKDFPNGERAIKALEFKATCYSGLGKFEEAADTWAVSLKPPYVDKLNTSERFALIRKISQVFYQMKNWEKGEPWFKEMLEKATTGEDKAYAAVALIRSYLAGDKFDEVKKLLPYLTYRQPARYDIALSVDFMSYGDRLANEKRFAEASLCYTFVLSKKEILSFFEAYKELLEKQIARMRTVNPKNPRIQELENKVAFAKANLEGVGGVADYSAQLLARRARNYFETKRNYESFWAYRQLLDNYPTDNAIEDYYLAAFICALQIGKEKQVDDLGSEYRTNFPEGKHIKDINLQFALFLLEKGKTDPTQKDRFFTVAKEALAANPDDDAAGEYILLMGKTWLEDKDFNQLNSYMRDFAEKNPQSKGADGAYYWQMLAALSEYDYAGAIKFANKLLTDYPDSIYTEDTTFRRAVAVFGDGMISDARKYFVEFIDTYKPMGSKLLGEAELFLGDISFMEQDYEDSYNHYMAVPDVTDNEKSIEAAYFQCASMLEAAERFDKQAEVLKKYKDSYPNGNIPMANYLLAKPLLKQGFAADAVLGYMDSIKQNGNDGTNDSIDKILQEFPSFYKEAKTQLDATTAFLEKIVNERPFLEMFVNNAGKRYEYTLENPDVNPLVYAMFKRKMDAKKALFGPEVLTDKAPIEKLLAQYKQQQGKFPKMTPEQFFNEQLKVARQKKSRVLENRMLMALDEMGKLAERPSMFGEDDFKGMPFKVIVWMGKSNERYNIESAREALNFVLKSDSDYRLDALLAMANLEERNGNYAEAFNYYKSAENDFPLSEQAANAALKGAEMLLKQGKISQARDKYVDMLRNPVWRGKTHAEVLYRLGMLEKDQNNINEAIMYFDRCALTYADVLEFSGKAVLQGAQLCVTSGKIDQAKEFCDTFLAEENNKACKEYAEVDKYRKSLR